MSNEPEVLLIDDVENPYYTYDNDFSALSDLQVKFIESYIQKKDYMPVETWLFEELKTHLPDVQESELVSMQKEIMQSLKKSQDKKQSLKSAIQQGRNKEHWIALELKNATSHMSTLAASDYLDQLDKAIRTANEQMAQTILTKQGYISLNPNLDGFIAEQYHVNTFNLNAQSTGSIYRAEVVLPKDGQIYGKNSVDIVIKDAYGKIVKKYQSKYCSDATKTKLSFENGDYRGQGKLVPEGHSSTMKRANEIIVAPDGTKSKALSKQEAKRMQEQAQQGKGLTHDWNDYQFKDVALGIGKQAGFAAIQGAAIGTGIALATKLYNREKIRGEEVVEAALKTGSDFGIKAATAGALKAGIEKGFITMIPKGTPAGTIANIAHVGIENVKILGKVASGELTIQEGLNEMEVTTVSTMAGIATSLEGAAIGAAIGTVFGPVGTAVGGFVGGVVGYAAGSKVAEKVVKGVQKVREKAKEIVNDTWESIKSTASSAWEGIKSFGKSLLTW